MTSPYGQIRCHGADADVTIGAPARQGYPRGA